MMNEIRCPKCGEVFKVDESNYAAIVQQVRDSEFKRDVEEQAELRLRNMESRARVEQAELKRLNEEALAKQQRESDAAVNELKNRISRLEAEKQMQEEALQAKADAKQQELQRLNEDSLNKQREKLNSEIGDLQEKIARLETEKQMQEGKLRAEAEAKQQEAERKYERERAEERDASNHKIEDLQKQLSEMQAKEEHSKLEQQSAIDRKNLEIAELNKRHEVELENKQREIDFYREFKAKLSTKMVGESLEQYCLNEFNKIRMIGFQNATFEKDNDARTGSKGDFIFRESRDGVEFISIMYEMKNEQDETATKKKNEDFLKELDKDRREKKCEYAVLVSMLEADNDFYNAGIVDMSHRYEKMYVVRPQCFIPLITLLRNAALSSLSYRKELVLAQQQSIDLANFESKMNTFKSDFNRNLTEVGSVSLGKDRQGEVYHRYCLGLYELLERLHTAYPALLLERCSDGGGRFDPAWLYYAPQIWTSDDTDAIERLDIQYGTSMVYPPSSMSAHVSACPNHQLKRTTPFTTRGNVALGGSFGYELDLLSLGDEEKALIRRQCADYHKYYDLTHYGDYYRLISPWKNRTECAWCFVSPDRSEALLTHVTIRGTIESRRRVKLQGLDPEKVYRVEETGEEYHGDTLMNYGYRISDLHVDFNSTRLHFVAI